MVETANRGMEGVIAAESGITWIDGIGGELRYRGYPIGELADGCTFEEVAYLLWYGELPDGEQLDALHVGLHEAQSRPDELYTLLESVPRDAHSLDVLRHVLARDALLNPLTWDNTDSANRRKALEMTGWFPVVVAAYHRLRQNLQPIPPRPDLDFAANVLYMLYGREATPDAVRTLDTSLILHADHELNASTFAARVTIATQSNLHAAIISALGTLTGPRHGGASDRVIHMLDEIGVPENVDAWVAETLSRRERVMGFGHRMYRTADPRSRHLRSMARRLLAGTEREPWTEILDRLSEVMAAQKGLYPNVDLYAALVNHALGIDPAFYTSVFALSRTTGWTAHVMEQLDGRMIRPAARYVGPPLRHVGERALSE